MAAKAKGSKKGHAAPAGASSPAAHALAEVQAFEAGEADEIGAQAADLESVAHGYERLHGWADSVALHAQEYLRERCNVRTFRRFDVQIGEGRKRAAAPDAKTLDVMRALGGEGLPLGATFRPASKRVGEDGGAADIGKIVIPHEGSRRQMAEAIFCGFAVAQCVTDMGEKAGEVNKAAAKQLLTLMGFTSGRDLSPKHKGKVVYTEVRRINAAFVPNSTPLADAVRAALVESEELWPEGLAFDKADAIVPRGSGRKEAVLQCPALLTHEQAVTALAWIDEQAEDGLAKGATVKSLLGVTREQVKEGKEPVRCPCRRKATPLERLPYVLSGKSMTCPLHARKLEQVQERVKLGEAQAANRAALAPTEEPSGPSEADAERKLAEADALEASALAALADSE